VLTLTNNNTYTGATILRGGGITLRDAGALLSTSGITNYFGTLTLDETGLARVSSRISGASFLGGTLIVLANETGSNAGVITLVGGANSGGANNINITPLTNTLLGGSVSLSLVRGGSGATVNFAATTGDSGLGRLRQPAGRVEFRLRPHQRDSGRLGDGGWDEFCHLFDASGSCGWSERL
jgi:autotransporter-associated beta strand protein